MGPRLLKVGDRVVVNAETLQRIREACQAAGETRPSGPGAVVLQDEKLADCRVVVRFDGKREPWPVPLSRVELEPQRALFTEGRTLVA